jgi:acyl carrier protein
VNTGERIRDFIIDQLRWRGSRRSLTEDRPLITDRILDSLAIFDLVSFLEAEFGIEVLDEELVLENFGTIAAIEAFIASKRGWRVQA